MSPSAETCIAIPPYITSGVWKWKWLWLALTHAPAKCATFGSNEFETILKTFGQSKVFLWVKQNYRQLLVTCQTTGAELICLEPEPNFWTASASTFKTKLLFCTNFHTISWQFEILLSWEHIYFHNFDFWQV